jgi:hypothetical protein
MKPMNERTKLLARVAGGALIAVATMGGIYAAAAGTATTLAATFNTQESASHTRSVQFTREAGRVADQHEADRTRCQRLAGGKRSACDAAARLRNAQTL